VETLKEQLVQKDRELEELLKTLYAKGAESGQLFEQLIELQNHMLD